MTKANDANQREICGGGIGAGTMDCEHLRNIGGAAHRSAERHPVLLQEWGP